jgi:hypothetical protein
MDTLPSASKNSESPANIHKIFYHQNLRRYSKTTLFMAALSEDCLYKGAHILEESTASIF